MSGDTSSFNAEAFQRRIEQMTDTQLIQQGKTAAEFAKMGFAGFPPEQVYVRQLEMCRAEWRRRCGFRTMPISVPG
jgi:hypothetical protein